MLRKPQMAELIAKTVAHSQFSAMATIVWKSHKIEYKLCLTDTEAYTLFDPSLTSAE